MCTALCFRCSQIIYLNEEDILSGIDLPRKQPPHRDWKADLARHREEQEEKESREKWAKEDMDQEDEDEDADENEGFGLNHVRWMKKEEQPDTREARSREEVKKPDEV